MALVREEARSYFWPAQVGVRVPGGAEKAIHTVRAWCHRQQDSNKVLLKLISVMLSTQSTGVLCSRRFRNIFRPSYNLTSGLLSLLAGYKVTPLGPLLFSAALQPIATTLRASDLDIAVHYLDDGVLAGNVIAVSNALKVVHAHAAAISPMPCSVTLLTVLARSAATLNSSGRLLVMLPLSETIRLTGLQRLGTSWMSWAPWKILKFHFGSSVLARALLACSSNPTAPQAIALDMFDGMVRRCFGDFTGLHPTNLQWRQAALGLAHGGLGLRPTSDHAPAAFLAFSH